MYTFCVLIFRLTQGPFFGYNTLTLKHKGALKWHT